ncbi:hypothetical protein GOP47_0020864 [Adiantum capillus-veneris]|uniref:Glutamyl/glutaminyl-tRNA synthetase class Ib catalytic domain-containing protein n=1 Tax=Adiantum capillus-veneris TaxID=13818 RepID=A0A9D4Z7D3_ADICA|nr:hypothetical protein GOP47_0020864 [Adiantum capillus-veneris]
MAGTQVPWLTHSAPCLPQLLSRARVCISTGSFARFPLVRFDLLPGSSFGINRSRKDSSLLFSLCIKAYSQTSNGAPEQSPNLQKQKPSDVRVRFAPSPTGNLHVGGARTALFNFLFARCTSSVKLLLYLRC